MVQAADYFAWLRGSFLSYPDNGYPTQVSQSEKYYAAGIYSLDATFSSEHPSTWEGTFAQYVLRVSLTPGHIARVDVQGSASGGCGAWPKVPRALAAAHAEAEITYGLRVVKDDPSAPNVPVPISLKARADVSVTPVPGGRPNSPWATATVKYRSPDSPYYETLLGAAQLRSSVRLADV